MATYPEGVKWELEFFPKYWPGNEINALGLGFTDSKTVQMGIDCDMTVYKILKFKMQTKPHWTSSPIQTSYILTGTTSIYAKKAGPLLKTM